MTPVAWRFYALSLLGAVLVALPFGLTGTPFSGVPGTLGGVVMMFAPLIAVLVLWRRGEIDLAETLPMHPTSWAWMGIALVLPVAINLLVAYAALLWPGVEAASGWEAVFARAEGLIPPEEIEAQMAELEGVPPVPVSVLSALFAGLTINGIAAFGEEAGWRGLMHRELRHLDPWRLAVLTGLLWGLWHAPVHLLGYNYPQHPLIGVFLFPVVLALLSPWMTLVRMKSGSVYSAALFHGAFNGSAGLAFLVASGGDDLTVGPGSLTAVAVLLILDLVLLAVWRPTAE
ncbi:MAG: CPBP family intramembrane metalloprotease [Deltaproteobacteria bacterium]|nr:MAG: CPBP family intramembrane metalloprotease [Deltaproteobacteria bacterium]